MGAPSWLRDLYNPFRSKIRRNLLVGAVGGLMRVTYGIPIDNDASKQWILSFEFYVEQGPGKSV